MHFALPYLAPRVPVLYAIIFRKAYDFALMSAVEQTPVLSDRETSLGARHVIEARRIRLGLAVSIDDNPRERSRLAYLTHYESGIVRERTMPGDTVTRLWSLHRAEL